MDRLAIIAGTGSLPHEIAQANPDAIFVTLAGVEVAVPEGHDHIAARYDKLGKLFKALKSAGATRVCFAGKVDRPKLNPLKMDMVTLGLFPRVKAVLGKGDDALLRLVAEVFEEQGFAVVAANQITDDLTLEAKIIGRAPSPQDHADAARGFAILAALDGQDVAQCVVVAAGQCLGIESIRGTDALLSYVGETPAHLKQGARGVFVKRPKSGQDTRMDIPTIGPQTIEAVARAGLGGIVIPSSGVLVLEKSRVAELVAQHDLFLEVQK